MSYLWTPVLADVRHRYPTPVKTLVLEVEVPPRTLKAVVRINTQGGFKSRPATQPIVLKVPEGDSPGACDLILCKGEILGSFGSDAQHVATLPAGYRPNDALFFTGRLENCLDGSLSLVSMAVDVEGKVYAAACDGTAANRRIQGALSIIAIRFSTSPGQPLTRCGSVTYHRVLNDSAVLLQGCMRDRSHRNESRLLVLPFACHPAENLHFVTCGGNGLTTAFHLLEVRERSGILGGTAMGGEVLWQDGLWERDSVHITGVLFPVDRRVTTKRDEETPAWLKDQQTSRGEEEQVAVA